MNVNVMKKVPLALVSFAVSGSAFAADMDSRVTQLEQQIKQVRTETAMGTYGARTAPSRPEVDGRGVFVSFDVLYWHAKVSGTEFAYTDNDPVSTLPINGSTKEVDFSWDWGFRAGLGYNFEHDAWDVFLNYTYFEPNADGHASAGLNSSVVPLKGSAFIVSAIPFTFCTNAKSQYSLDDQSIDLELGRSYFVSKQVSFRPHFGLKSLWLDQKQTTRYTGGTPSGTDLGLGVNTVEIKDKSDFWGMGPRAGVDSKWFLGNGFSVFGNLSGSLLFGRFKVRHKETYSLTPETNQIRLTADMHRFAPVMQMVLGLAYDQYVYDKKQHIGISLGYDCQYMWSQNQMLTIVDAEVLKYGRTNGDVGIQGVTGHFRWDF